MSDLFDFQAKSTQFAVMGNPIKHSQSPFIHRLFAKQCRINMTYDRIQVDLGGFDQAVSHFAAHGGGGLNVTVPFKIEAWQLCRRKRNRLSERAARAQSVNTLKIQQDGTLFGDNTDGVGLIRDIERNIDHSIRDKQVLIIGAGGAVRGIVGPLLERQPVQLTIANRTAEKSHRLAQYFGDNVSGCGLDKTDHAGYDLVINGSAASLSETLPAIHSHCIRSHTVVYDMMYGAQPTVFMKWALCAGAKSAHDGLGMLVEQAGESFFVWHQRRPDTRTVIETLRAGNAKPRQ